MILLPPGADAVLMKPTKTLQPGHGNADLELLEADYALGGVGAVLLGGDVWKHTNRAQGAPRV